MASSLKMSLLILNLCNLTGLYSPYVKMPTLYKYVFALTSLTPKSHLRKLHGRHMTKLGIGQLGKCPHVPPIMGTTAPHPYMGQLDFPLGLLNILMWHPGPTIQPLVGFREKTPKTCIL